MKEINNERKGANNYQKNESWIKAEREKDRISFDKQKNLYAS